MIVIVGSGSKINFNYILNFLKITKDKIKLFLLFLLSFYVVSFGCGFCVSVIEGMNPQGRVSVVIQLFNFLNLLVVSYILVAFIKKEFFMKKYVENFVKVFLILLVFEKLLEIILFVFFKFLPAEIYFSNAMQIIDFLIGAAIYYIAVCCVDSFIAK